MKKINILIIIGIVAMSLLCGCGAKAKPEKEYNNEPVFSSEWLIDELGWIDNGGKELEKALQGFYEETGIKPMVYLYGYDGTERWRTIEMAKEKAEELYSKIFGTEGNHLLFVFFEGEYDTPSRMEGCMSYVLGDEVKDLMDYKAKDTFEKIYWKHYNNTKITVEEVFANTFEEAGTVIMN